MKIFSLTFVSSLVCSMVQAQQQSNGGLRGINLPVFNSEDFLNDLAVSNALPRSILNNNNNAGNGGLLGNLPTLNGLNTPYTIPGRSLPSIRDGPLYQPDALSNLNILNRNGSTTALPIFMTPEWILEDSNAAQWSRQQAEKDILVDPAGALAALDAKWKNGTGGGLFVPGGAAEAVASSTGIDDRSPIPAVALNTLGNAVLYARDATAGMIAKAGGNSDGFVQMTQKALDSGLASASMASGALTLFGQSASERGSSSQFDASKKAPIAGSGNAFVLYKVLGEGPQWVISTPGGQTSMEEDPIPAASLMKEPGWEQKYRIVIWDRRNTGGSSLVYDSFSQPETDLQVDDLASLMAAEGIQKAILIGNSAGSRLSLKFALKYPSKVEKLILRNVSGGNLAGQGLGSAYYGQYATIANKGMQYLLNTPFYSKNIAKNPANKDRLLAVDQQFFIQYMNANAQALYTSGSRNDPVLGLQASDLNSVGSLNIPALVIMCQYPEDGIHTKVAAEAAARALRTNVVYGTYSDTYASGGWPKSIVDFVHAQ